MSRGRLGATLFFSVLVCLVATVAAFRPYDNFDLMGYLGCAELLTKGDVVQAQRAAYADVASVSPEHLRSLTAASSYRQALALDVSAFTQNLSFYAIRPVYVAAIYLLSRLGLSTRHAVYAVSLFSMVVSAFLLFYWLCRTLKPLPAAILGAILLWIIQSLGQFATPDALSTLVVLAAMFIAFELRKYSLAALVLLFSVAVRTDNIVLLVVFTIYLAFRKQISKRDAAALLISGMAVLTFISVRAAAYAWRTLFWHSFIEALAQPADSTRVVGARLYALTLARNSSIVLSEQILLAAVLCIAFWSSRAVLRDLLAIITLSTVLSFAVYPSIEPRRFVLLKIIAVLVAGITAASQLSDPAAKPLVPFRAATANLSR